jgi:hypothetical protein
MSTKRLCTILGVALIACVWVPRSTAQITAGSVTGSVLDQSGGAVPGATLRLSNENTGAVRSAKTNSSGIYVFTLVPPGPYRLAVQRTGFATVVQTHVRILVNEATRVDFTLHPAAVQTTVTVSGAPPALQTQSAAVGGVLGHEVINDLPLNGRNFVQLVALEPGAISTEKLPGGGVSYLTSAFGGNYIVNGAPSDATSFVLDGIEMRDVNDTRVGFEPTVDAIQEFNFQAINYSAQFGGAAGGVTNISSRGGTNQLHGSAWEFLRNDAFDARNFFNTTKPEYRQNQFGGAIGGPIAKNKMFFFASYEGLRIVQGLSQAETVPTLAERMGDFSAGSPIFDPLSVNPSTGLRNPFPANQIPPNLFSPVSVKALDRLYPLPNLPGTVNNLLGTANQLNTSDQVNSRIDRTISQADSIFGRVTVVRVNRDVPFTFSGMANFINVYDSPDTNFVLSETHSFDPQTVNQAEIGYNRHTQILQDLQQDVPVNQQLGITGTSTKYLGNPSIAIAGLSETGAIGNAPNNRSDNAFTILDNLTLVRGNNEFLVGFRGVKFQVNGQTTPNGHGYFNFDGAMTSQLTATGAAVTGTGNPVADFLLGFPIETGNCCTTGSPHRNTRSTQIGSYFQDNWKARRNLTFNLGIRWDYYGPLYDTENRFDEPNLADAPQLVLLFAGKNGVPRGFQKPQYYNWQPRLGFAYSVTPRTVVRGGYGLFFNPSSMVWGVLNDANPPFTDLNTFFSSPTTPTLLTLAVPFPTGVSVPSTAYGGWSLSLRNPYDQAWNFAIQRAVGRGIVLTATYVGNKGTKLDIGSENVNAPPPGPGSIAARSLIPSVSSISLDEGAGKSIYNGLELKAEKRLTQNLGFLASYTYSKCMDVGGTNSTYDGAADAGRDPLNTTAAYGLCDNDIRNVFTANAMYGLPFGRNLSPGLAWVASGWTIDAIVTAEGGQPSNVYLPYDNSNTGIFEDFPNLVLGQNPNTGPKIPTQWWNAKAYVDPPAYTFGNAGRNIAIGPGLADLDFAVHRDFRITERQTLQFRTEVFDILNRPNFEQPGYDFGTPSFGVIGAALNNREIQFALKYLF